MTAPLEIANRFDILVDLKPDTLEAVLAHFDETPFDRSTVRTTRHADGTLVVKVIVKRLAEDRARAIHDALKKNDRVFDARLEHFWP
ncbi:hypothetical protein [Kordiimonas aestuarii]|uniref:hypothetical protein n=1 Tax=Kordiimonas aestuarii TaxID=1005925 RepID=UPI0021CF0054|nr:hypothetical protein [Kordiimonas aestuarii]